LPDEVKAEIVKSLKGHFEEEDEGFLHQIVTGDENWVYHYDPEKKKMVCGISPQSSTIAREIQNPSLCW